MGESVLKMITSLSNSFELNTDEFMAHLHWEKCLAILDISILLFLGQLFLALASHTLLISIVDF